MTCGLSAQTAALCSYLGFLKTSITESPLKNSLLMNLSLLTGLAPFLPLPVFGTCTMAAKITYVTGQVGYH